MAFQNESTSQKVHGKDNKLESAISTSSLQERSQLIKFFGKIVIFLSLVSFLFVGLIINCLQVILLLTSKLSDSVRWKTLHKKLNGYLVFTLFSPPTSLLYWWSNVNLNIKLKDVSLIEDSKKPLLGVIIPNHSYELDYMVSYILADQLGGLGAYKSLSKDELKYLPIIGWAMWMSDMVYVKRDWKQDRLTIGAKLNQLFYYEQSILALFAEGTRWTPEKHEASVKYALSRGIKPLKYHLIPRTRGFIYTIRHYVREMTFNRVDDDRAIRIFNLQMLLPDKPKFRDFMDGRQLRADVYCEEVILSSEIRDEILKSKDEDECPLLAQLLQEIYERKDDLVDEYLMNGNKFKVDSATGGDFPFKHRKLPIIIWLLGLCFTHSTFAYLAVTTFVDSLVFWSLLIGFITACFLMLKRIARESRVMSSSQNNSAKLADASNSCVKEKTIDRIVAKKDVLSGKRYSQAEYLAINSSSAC